MVMLLSPINVRGKVCLFVRLVIKCYSQYQSVKPVQCIMRGSKCLVQGHNPVLVGFKTHISLARNLMLYH